MELSLKLVISLNPAVVSGAGVGLRGPVVVIATVIADTGLPCACTVGA